MTNQSRRWRKWYLCMLLPITLLAHATVQAQTLETVDELWRQTQEAAQDLWRSARDWSQEGDDFSELWQDIVPTLDETLTLEDRHEALPENAWFRTDQASNQDDINVLLDEAIDILSIAPAQRYRQQIRALESAIDEARAEIDQYRRERVAAPEDAVWRKTAGDYHAAIQDAKARIDANQAELEALKQEFAKELQTLGLTINDEQLEFLLSTVIGDDLIEMSLAFDNVKQLTVQLEQLMAESQEDLASARRYYGMYAVLLKALERMHQKLIETVQTQYLVDIDAIIERTQTLMKESRALMRRADNSREILAANIEAQQLTLRTATLYRDYLTDQVGAVAAARAQLIEDIAIAENTYETVKVSGELVQLMKSSQNLLDTLLARQTPALRTFQNLEMKREFEKLTLRLKAKDAA